MKNVFFFIFIVIRERNLLDYHKIPAFVPFDCILRILDFHLDVVVYDEHKVDFDEENLFGIIHN